MTGGGPALPHGAEHASASTVGGWLRTAREAAGLSEDAVAQQLKLAPRQVRAIEEDDYALLPGRTFVRGFVRNYARLVHLDPDAVVAALPIGEPVSPLERLTYTPSSRPMGDIPMETPRRGGSAARWLIPLLLLAVVAVAAYYEFLRPQARRPVIPDGVMPPSLPKAAPGAPAVTPLPNPLDAPKSDAAPPAVVSPTPASADSATRPDNAATATAPSTQAAPASTATAAPPISTTAPSANVSPAAPVNVTTAAPATPGSPAPAPHPVPSPTEASAAIASDPTLVLTFTGTSWVQVKDASGAVIMSQTSTTGATVPVSGRPPFSVVIGNADHVRTQFRGKPVDLAPHTVHNVARLTLK